MADGNIEDKKTYDVDKKSTDLKIRVTPEFKRQLKNMAVDLGMNMSSLITKTFMQNEAKFTKTVYKLNPKLIVAMARIGNNLNQIARSLNYAKAQNAIEPINFVEILVTLKSIEANMEGLRDDQ